jgi:hypothetical protein
MDTTHERELVIDQVAESEAETAALRKHVKEIAEGSAFKGSERCKKFLGYVVERAIAGHADALKERVIGVEVFGLSPSYDTKEEAIVRVTASDVRKRLLQHYGKDGLASPFHISVPIGSYIPEVTRFGEGRADRIEFLKLRNAPSAASNSHVAGQESVLHAHANFERGGSVAEISVAQAVASKRPAFLALIAVAVVLIAALSAALWGLMRASSARAKVLSAPSLPWSSIWASPRATHLITSDVDIVRIQNILVRRISVSDYANHNYVSEHTAEGADDRRELATLIRGNKTATHDAHIAANIAELAGANARQIDVEGAREIQLSDLKTDDNFIFLGSPFSNPWFSLFSDQLDFQFVPRGVAGLGTEDVLNAHPVANEQSIYTSTAGGGSTGEQYAIAAFVGNPGQRGQVLLLAGASGEGTTAAAMLVTDLPRLSMALQRCGIPPSGPPKHFEFLLRVNTMAGIPNQFDIVNCHILK